MKTIDFEDERKDGILNNLKKWNLDGMNCNINEEDFELLNDIDKNTIVANRMMSIFQYYFEQLKKAKQEIKGIFSKDEILLMLNKNISYVGTIFDNKENFISSCCTDFFSDFVYIDKESSLFNKINKLSEMQVHALLCTFKEINGEFDINELFGCVGDKKIDKIINLQEKITSGNYIKNKKKKTTNGI